MPYIFPEAREELDNYPFESTTPGELNYVITKLCKSYITRLGESYQVYNDIIGVLGCCHSEIYRRLIAKYEDKKILDNGDVF